MNTTSIKEQARNLFSEASYISHISSDTDYQLALELMDDLIEDYDLNRPLIGVLANSIEHWEESADEFSEFNATIERMDGVSTLKLLIEQHHLSLNDLPEIGSKSLVSKILNRKDRNLTRNHIEALSKRFSVSPALFF